MHDEDENLLDPEVGLDDEELNDEDLDDLPTDGFEDEEDM